MSETIQNNLDKFFFHWKNLTSLGVPSSSLGAVFDNESIYKRFPKRFNFYMQVLESITNPNPKVLETIVKKENQTRFQREEIQDKLKTITQYFSNSGLSGKEIAEKIKNKLAGNLLTRDIEVNDDIKDIVNEQFNKVKSVLENDREVMTQVGKGLVDYTIKDFKNKLSVATTYVPTALIQHWDEYLSIYDKIMDDVKKIPGKLEEYGGNQDLLKNIQGFDKMIQDIREEISMDDKKKIDVGVVVDQVIGKLTRGEIITKLPSPQTFKVSTQWPFTKVAATAWEGIRTEAEEWNTKNKEYVQADADAAAAAAAAGSVLAMARATARRSSEEAKKLYEETFNKILREDVPTTPPESNSLLQFLTTIKDNLKDLPNKKEVAIKATEAFIITLGPKTGGSARINLEDLVAAAFPQTGGGPGINTLKAKLFPSVEQTTRDTGSPAELFTKNLATDKDRDEMIDKYDNDVYFSPDNEKVNWSDRAIFLALTYIIRAVSLFLTEWAIYSGFINNFVNAFALYFGMYTSIFLLVVFLTNARRNDMVFRMIFFYMNSQSEDGKGVIRIIVHLICILMLLPIPYVVKEYREFDQPSVLSFSDKATILSGVEKFSMYTWILTSIVALNV